MLLKAADRRLGLIATLTDSLRDQRQPGKVVHGLEELLAQRVYGIACGYPDANDGARLGDDPIHKLLLGRDPITGDALASQPTLSRFENAPSRGELLAMSEGLFETVLERHARRLRGKLRRITVDLDVTDDPTHGAQQLAFFNGHYGHWYYLPMVAFLTFNGEREQYLCAAVLRSGNAPTQRGTLPLLKAAHTGWARAQVSTLHEQVLKLGVHVAVSVRRLVLHLPEAFQFRDDWQRLALALGARAG